MESINKPNRGEGEQPAEGEKPEMSISKIAQDQKRDSTVDQLGDEEKRNVGASSGELKEDETLGIP